MTKEKHEHLRLPKPTSIPLPRQEPWTSTDFDLPLPLLKEAEKYAKIEDLDVSDLIVSGLKNVLEFLREKHKKEDNDN